MSRDKTGWRSIDVKPNTIEPITALLAERDEDGEYFLRGIYLWRNGDWVDEDQLKPLERVTGCNYWWYAEDEVLADLQASVPV